MPFIHIRAFSGKDMEAKKKMAQAIVKAASEVTGTREGAFVVAYEDVEREAWEKDVVQGIIEPLGDKVIIERRPAG